MYAAVSIYIYIHSENELTENSNFCLFATNRNVNSNVNSKLPFVCCKQKQKICFPWSANDKK